MRLDPTDLALAHVAQTNTVAAAQARADQTEADEKRYRELVGAGAVSASQYDQAKAAADSARAQLKAAKAEAEVAQDSVGYAVLEADSDGVVVETLAEPGQVVSAGQPVVRLAKAGPREALVNLPETLRPPIGATAMATVFGRTDQASAKLRELSDSANPLTRTFEARYVLAAPASAAPLGTTVTVALDAGGAASKVTVPLGAVTDRGDGPGVWVVHGTPTKLAWRPVKLAGLSDESATITSGLNPGDRFVSLGAHSLHADEEVRIEDGPKK
jgi:RND family efflux transporter MFP subunit